MATEFCRRCKEAHPGRPCDYDDKGECAETIDSQESGTKPLDNTPLRRESSEMQSASADYSFGGLPLNGTVYAFIMHFAGD